jgi:hypothetical protein
MPSLGLFVGLILLLGLPNDARRATTLAGMLSGRIKIAEAALAVLFVRRRAAGWMLNRSLVAIGGWHVLSPKLFAVNKRG